MHPYQKLLHQFSEYSTKSLPEGEPVELYEPIKYMMGLGGKQMRPLLVLAGCDLFNGNINNALPVAFAMELFHNFSLVHDDIMDDAPLRRKQPTVHEKYSRNVAILSGDVMLVYVYERLMSAPPGKIMELMQVFNDTAIKVCEGQQMDMNFETRDNVSVREYLKMITYKTAVLLGCCLQCGSIAGGADAVEAKKLYEYGLLNGVAFQLQDDLLDTFGGVDFGKEIGGDIKRNKKTFLLIKTRELAQGRDKALLEEQLKDETGSAEKVQIITDLYLKLGVKELAEQQMQMHYKKGIELLDSVKADPAKKQMLKGYTGELMVRKV